MNKKKIKIIISCILALAAASGIFVLAGATSAYDTNSDPVVALSYLNDIFLPQIRGEWSGSVQALTERVAALERENASLKSKLDRSQYEVVFLNKGEKIIAEYTCEIILRSGEAVIHSPQAGLGINNITQGRDMYAGESVPAFHGLIIPRGGDGRGLTVTSDGGAYFMLKGGYVIDKAE